VSDSEENNMDDDDHREILWTEQPLSLPDSSIAYFHLVFTDLILTLMVTESNR
jgi:hypothetical protein